MSEQAQVERLARVLYEGQPVVLAAWEELNNFQRKHWRHIASQATAKGVTLAAPAAAPKALSPLEAAAREMAKWGWGGGQISEQDASDAMSGARAVLAAAVGALPDGPHPDECSIGSGMERQLVSRAALLEALTEGGEG